MQNPVNYLIENVCGYFLQASANDFGKSASSLVRIHFEKLKNTGDISFPCNAIIWRNYFQNSSRSLQEQAFAMFEDSMPSVEVEKLRNDFLAYAAKWTYPVARLQMQNERCALFLQRGAVTTLLLRQVLNADDNYGQQRRDPRRRLYFPMQQNDDARDPNDLSFYRAKLIEKTLRRVLNYSEWMLETDLPLADRHNTLELRVLSVAAKGGKKEGTQQVVTIKCGIVTDSINGKLAKMETQEYLNLRSNDMRLMAMHKYGIRAKDDARFCALMERLGAAAVTVDLLEVKHTSPVQIIRNGQGSTKGASFILYNSARLESLLRTFEERVQSADYSQLPNVNDVDLSLLTEEEEWQLVYGYIFTFPNLIERCLEQLERGVCATHLIVRFLSGFVSIFSVYYRRIRILTETREHLMPYVYARIYLIKAVREILNKTLALLDIEPVLFM